MYVNVDEGSDPVLMIPAAGVSGWMWRPLRELLGPTMKAIVPDLPGFGRSAAQPYVSHEDTELTASALPGSTLRTVPGAAHDIPFSQPGIIASTLNGQIIGFTA